MLDTIGREIRAIASILNENQGVLTLAIFIATLLMGWVSGIFSSLRMKPKLTASLIEGPTFSCTYPTGNIYNGYEAHRTGIALYLNISNLGSAPTDISAIEVGYHWSLKPTSIAWIRYRIGWFWLKSQSVSLADFQARIGESIKVYPFLTQRNSMSPSLAKTYLRVGELTNGVVYFEQHESWGGCFPLPSSGRTKIKLRLVDAHGNSFMSHHAIPVVTLDQAQKYNPRFGETLVALDKSLIVACASTARR